MRRLVLSFAPAKATVPVLIALLLTGCGNDSEEKATPATTTTMPVASKVNVENAVIKATDLPGSWYENKSSATNEAVQSANAALVSCLALSEPQRSAQTWFEKDGQAISSNVRAYDSADKARTDLAALKSPKASQCAAPQINILVKNSFAAIATNPITEVGAIPDRQLKEDEFGLRATSTVKMEGAPIIVTTDYVGMTTGATSASITMTYIATPPPRDLEDTLLSKLRERVS